MSPKIIKVSGSEILAMGCILPSRAADSHQNPKRLLRAGERMSAAIAERRSKNLDPGHLMAAVRIVPVILLWWNCPLGQWPRLRLAKRGHLDKLGNASANGCNGTADHHGWCG